MVRTVPTLKDIVLDYVCKNIDAIFRKKLHKIRAYLKEQECDDITDYFIDDQELSEESKLHHENVNHDSGTNALDALRNFVKSQGLPKIVWRETSKNSRTLTIGLDINNVTVEVEGNSKDEDSKAEARYLAAKLMLRKLYARHLSDPILNHYCKYENHNRSQIYESESLFRRSIPRCTINKIDELQGLDFTEKERAEILRNIPEYKLRRSHFLLLLHPGSRELDFSFCPGVFSEKFLGLVLRKATNVETVNLNNCNKSVNSVGCIITVLKQCKNIMSLNINKCGFVSSERVFNTLRRYRIDLKELSMAKTIKKNMQGSYEFQKYFNSILGRRLISLDLSGLHICENELYDVITNCKRLENLNLSGTEFDTCYCEHHSTVVEYDKTLIAGLRELNVSRSHCKEKVLKLLVDNNKALTKLYTASVVLSNPLEEPLNLIQLEQLRVLDFSFQGCGAYEDFSLYKDDLPCSLMSLNASGYCDVDVSHLSVVCPYLNALTLNTSIVNMNMTCRTREDSQGRVHDISHRLQNFAYLSRLELRYTSVNLTTLITSAKPLPLQQLIVEGDCLDDSSLTYIVNSSIPFASGRTVHVFEKLRSFHICNCNNVTDFGIDQSNFWDMPSLRDLTIERCSGIRSGKLIRLQNELKFSTVTLTCFVNDERPRFHARNNTEVIMG